METFLGSSGRRQTCEDGGETDLGMRSCGQAACRCLPQKWHVPRYAQRPATATPPCLAVKLLGYTIGAVNLLIPFSGSESPKFFSLTIDHGGFQSTEDRDFGGLLICTLERLTLETECSRNHFQDLIPLLVYRILANRVHMSRQISGRSLGLAHDFILYILWRSSF